MKQPSHHQIATYLTDYALSELVRYTMEDTGCSIEQAMEQVLLLHEGAGHSAGSLKTQSFLCLHLLLAGLPSPR